MTARRKRARNRTMRRNNAVVDTFRNFFLALSVGAAGSTLAPFITGSRETGARSLLGVAATIVLISMAAYIASHREKE